MTSSDLSASIIPKPRPRRRWFRFRLRTFLIFILLLAALLAWYVNRVERQRRAVAFIESNGGYVLYDFEDDDYGLGPKHVERIEWLDRWLPVDFISSATRAYIESGEDLRLVSGIPNLKHLDLWEFKGQDLSPIANLHRLKILSIYMDEKVPVEVDLAPLANIRSLEELSVTARTVRNLAPLASLSKLKTFDLDLRGSQDVDLTPISRLHQLQTLDINADFCELHSSRALLLPRLRELFLLADGIGSLSNYAELKGLEKLEIYCSGLSSMPSSDSLMGPIANLTSLKELVFFGGEHITDISAVQSLTHLEFLVIGGNQRLSDLTPLAELKKLKLLTVDDTDVSDLRPLSGLESLEWLEVSKTHVNDLTPLAGLKKLKSVNLSYTAVSDVGVLKELTALKTISLQITCVTQDQIDSLQLALPNCRIWVDE